MRKDWEWSRCGHTLPRLQSSGRREASTWSGDTDRIPAMQDLMAGFLSAPLWARIGMVFFAVAFLAMLVEPRWTRRRYAAAFSALASAAGAPTTRRDEFTEWFTLDVEGRPFDVRRELRVRGSGYRGPTGHLLVTSTPLSGSRWKTHQVDITPGRAPSYFGAPPLATGDTVFDGRFVVMQDGVPVREKWLDPQTRAAVTAFFDQPAATGPVWVQEQRLQHLADATWRKSLDLATLTILLRQQAELAAALERTAGWNGRTDGAS